MAIAAADLVVVYGSSLGEITCLRSELGAFQTAITISFEFVGDVLLGAVILITEKSSVFEMQFRIAQEMLLLFEDIQLPRQRLLLVTLVSLFLLVKSLMSDKRMIPQSNSNQLLIHKILVVVLRSRSSCPKNSCPKNESL